MCSTKPLFIPSKKKKGDLILVPNYGQRKDAQDTHRFIQHTIKRKSRARLT